jgi:hypothetical protein
MAALDRPAYQVAAQAAALAPQLAAFCAAHLPLGRAVQQSKEQLNAIPDFGIAQPLLQRLDEALRDGLDVGADAWNSVAREVRAIAAGSSGLDWKVLAGPDIAAAIAGWKRVHARASEFAAHIQDWACPEFMSGSWITGSLPMTSVFTATDDAGLFGQYLMLSAGRTPPYKLPLVQETQSLPLAVTHD